jgi:hypothetical protein
MKLIFKHTVPGSTIVTDGLASYDSEWLENRGYIHRRYPHS